MKKLNKVLSILRSVFFTLELASILGIVLFPQISKTSAYVGLVFLILMIASGIGWVLTYDWGVRNSDNTNEWGE